MNIIINGKIGFNDETPVFTAADRAFRYGDGLFESMMYKDNTLRFWNSHYERLTKGMQILKMDRSNLPDKNRLQNEVMELVAANRWTMARIKLVVWRQSGGLYTPVSNQINYMIEAVDFVPPAPSADWLEDTYQVVKTSFAKSIVVSFSAISHLKTCNALPYVIASIEKSERKLDDLLLLNNEGHLAESTHSNIFWFKKGILFTPSINTGCLAGVMRRHILQNWLAANYEYIETQQGREIVMDADVVFTSNAFGIKFVTHIDDHLFDRQKAIEFINSRYFSSIAPLL